MASSEFLSAFREQLNSGPGDASSLSRLRLAASDLREALLSVLGEERERFLLEKWSGIPEDERRAAFLRDQWEFFVRFTMGCVCCRDRFRLDYGSREALRVALNKVLNNLRFLVQISERMFSRSTNPLAAPFVEMLAVGCEKFAARSRTYRFGSFCRGTWSGSLPGCYAVFPGTRSVSPVPGCCLFGLLLLSGMFVFDLLSGPDSD